MEPKFKVGDKVRIAKRRYRSGDYKLTFTDIMAEYSGQVSTIEKVYPLSSKKYAVEDDGIAYWLTGVPFNWTSGMLEPVESVDTAYASIPNYESSKENPATEREPLKIRVKSKRIMFNFKN